MADDPFRSVNPPLPSHLQPVVPVLARRGVYTPQIGKKMSVDLGGEIVEAEVTQVFSHDVIVIKVTGIVVDKSNHGFKKGSVVPMQRSWNGLQEVWIPISERETREREHLERIERQVKADEEEKRRAAMARQAQPPEPPPPDPVSIQLDDNRPPEPVGADAEMSAPRRVLGPRRSRIARP